MKGKYNSRLFALLMAGGITTSPIVLADYEWAYQYNDKGQVIQSDGPRTDVDDITQYDYDDQGRLIKVTNALGHTSHLSNFNLFGSPQTVIDPNGLQITLNYDALGRLTGYTSHSSQGDSTTAYMYNSVGLITQITLPDGSSFEYGYDSARRLISITNNLGESINYTLDAMGNRTEEVVKDDGGQISAQSTRVFDEMGRLLEWVGADEQSTYFFHDVDSNLIHTTDANGNHTRQAYDALHRLTQVTDAHDQITQLTFDQQDNLTSVTDPRGIVTNYTYDAFGRVIERNSPDTGITSYSYDAAGNIVQSTNARGVVIDYEYDALNRLIALKYPADTTENLAFIYDQSNTEGESLNAGIGRLTEIHDRLGQINYRYDDRGNRIESTRQINVGTHQSTQTTVYNWSLGDNLTAIEYPSGLSLNYIRNGAGQVESINYTTSKGNQQVATGLSYQPFGGVKQMSLGNGIEQFRSFDLDGRVIEHNVGTLQTLDYQYDAVSNITQIVRTDQISAASSAVQTVNQNFTYDGLNRLTLEQGEYGQKSYTYDAIGNRTLRTTTTQNSDGSDKVRNQNLTYTAESNRVEKLGNRYLNYTADGNTLDGLVIQQNYSYDHTGRLKGITKNGVQRSQYFYNGLGERSVKVVPTLSGLTYRIYEYGINGQLLQESYYNTAGVLKQAYLYLWLDNQPLAYVTQTFTNAGALFKEELAYIHTDHLNTPRLATDVNQTVVWRWDSDAFGIGAADKDPDGNGKSVNIALRFPGQYYDAESGLHYNYYRDYDPRTGRYIQSDPIGLEGGLNTYAYVMGNPLRFSDPYGLAPGDKFISPDDAAIDAGNFARSMSDQSIEYGGWIRQVGDCWTYNFLIGGKTSLDSNLLKATRPDGSRNIWHTHPEGHSYIRAERFSRADKNTAEAFDLGVYLNTPSGSNMLYDPRNEFEKLRVIKKSEAESCGC